jgi:integrase
VATLSSALADAVERRRLPHNVAKHASLPPEKREERVPWTAQQAGRFLAHVQDHEFGALFEVLIGTGLRRGEALGLRWEDVDLDHRVLQVRRTLGLVNGRLVFGEPKTKGSAAGVGLSTRVVAALRRQQAAQAVNRAEWAEAYELGEGGGLVFARVNGSPLRPERVLSVFHTLVEEAGVPQVRLHDLRHLAATMMIGAGVPLPIVSKVLRHSKVGITSDRYGHLSREIATDAADIHGPRSTLLLRSTPRSGPRNWPCRKSMRPPCDHTTAMVTLCFSLHPVLMQVRRLR